MSNIIPFPNNFIKRKAPPRVISIITTNFRFIRPCTDCKKEEGIIAGVPNSFKIKLPMTDEEFENIHTKPFFILVPFEVRCNNGLSHIAVDINLKNSDHKFVVSSEPGFKVGYWEEDESLEKALYRFLPHFVNIKRSHFLPW